MNSLFLTVEECATVCKQNNLYGLEFIYIIMVGFVFYIISDNMATMDKMEAVQNHPKKEKILKILNAHKNVKIAGMLLQVIGIIWGVFLR